MLRPPSPPKEELHQFIRWSRQIGHDPFQTQAAGGNLSVKRDGREMLIKTSGARLRDVSSTFGWTFLDYPRLRGEMIALHKRLPPGDAREIGYAGAVQEASLRAGARPSMEAGFHAVIPEKYVFHIHSISGLVLSLVNRTQAERWIRSRWKQRARIRWIPTRLPGMELSWEIHRRARASRPGSEPSLWFIANHGLIWSGNDWKVLWKAILSFEKTFQAFFKLRRFPPPHALGGRGCRQSARPQAPETSAAFNAHLCFCRWPHVRFDTRPLFPDLIIYFDLLAKQQPDLVQTSPQTAWISARDEANRRDKTEVLYSHVLVSSLLDRLKAKPHRLDGELIHRIKNLETERARMKLMAQQATAAATR